MAFTFPRTVVAFILCLGLILCAGCGSDDDGPAPFILTIDTTDILLPAVQLVEIELSPNPMALDQMFAPRPEMMLFGGDGTARVTGDGNFYITLNRAYVEREAVPKMGGQTFTLDVPLQAESSADTPGILDPRIDVHFQRNGVRIGTAAAFLPWPPPAGGTQALRVNCNRTMGIGPECSNNDGAMPTPMPEGGVDGG
ncbi:MAG: hypothetical protein AAGF12_27740 [Myxococcota bacterium]